ncbi:hypothetical protein AsAng_0006890 [Aureispira anguillae]|uniref:Uncharacterized protein n=1 Tax=Aureispira anguillae TaxID=2864201 RepID=A0A916DNM4_9BACT|nr:hypothetical protein AsAng_0006890 [Aureispira anguillae]
MINYRNNLILTLNITPLKTALNGIRLLQTKTLKHGLSTKYKALFIFFVKTSNNLTC